MRPRREAIGETGLKIELLCQFCTYSDSFPDSRHYNISTVFIAKAIRNTKAGSDVKQARVFTTLSEPLLFEYAKNT